LLAAAAALAQDAPLSVMVGDHAYEVTGTAVRSRTGSEPEDDATREKARFTALVLDKEILNSQDNRRIYSAANRAAVFADAASKHWVEPWRAPLVRAPAGPGGGVAAMVAEAQALAEAKRAFAAWIAKLADNPKELALAIARRDYMDGVRAFRENSAIYRKVTVKNGILTYEEALRFQRNQVAVLRMAYARALEEQLQRGNIAAGPATGNDGATPHNGAEARGGKDQAAADGAPRAGEGSGTSLKHRLESEVASGVAEVKSVAELESRFDDMRKVVESDASGIEQHRELKEYFKATTDLRSNDDQVASRSGGPAPTPSYSAAPDAPQAPTIDLRPAQRLLGTFANARAAPAPRYRTSPTVAVQAQRAVVWPKGTQPQRQSDITGLDRTKVGGTNQQATGITPPQVTFTFPPQVKGTYRPITREQAQGVVGKYRSIPGGITLEGGSPDLTFVKTVTYLPDVNAFILNDDIVYLSPVTADEFLQIARALAADDKMGVSLGSIAIVYGQLPPQGTVARNLKLADSFLGGIAFGDASRARGYVYAPGFQPVDSSPGGPIAVYFNIHAYRFIEEPSGELRRDGLAVDITLVPLSSQKAADGGHGPDFDRIEKGDLPAAHVANVKHLQSNLDYYGRERIVRSAFAYGEIAAFARTLKQNGVRMGSQAR
jgi:hypothetical protein